jgi:hypothetical protein
VNESQARSLALTKEGATGVISPDLSEIIGYEDIATAAAELIRVPHAFLNSYSDLTQKRSLSDPIVTALAFYLLPRLKLGLPFSAGYSDREYFRVMANSSSVNATYDLLSGRNKERFIEKNPFAGFAQFFANEARTNETAKVFAILDHDGHENDVHDQIEINTFQLGLELLFDDAVAINDDLGSLKLPRYEQQKSDSRTADLINALGVYFTKNDYGGINYLQLVILEECIAYVKRFHRHHWHVEIEDVLEAWYIINHCKQPRPPLSRSLRKILDYVKAQNGQGKFPTQRQIIKQTGLAYNTVSQALGLKIKSWEGTGTLIVGGYVEYDDGCGGYRITEFGELTIDSDFHITVGKETYVPKNPLES